MIETICSEMGKGNFSFLILVVGVLQLVVMIWNGRKGKNGNNQKK